MQKFVTVFIISVFLFPILQHFPKNFQNFSNNEQLSYRVMEKPYDTSFSLNSSFESVDIDSSDMHRFISGLEPSTKYDFRLKGFNSAGVGEKATLETFTAVETGIVGHHSVIKISLKW